MTFYQLYYRIAFLTAGVLHLYWNDIVDACLKMVIMCLSASSQPIILRLMRLHAMVMICFVFGMLFNTVSAASGQVVLEGENTSLHFDDIDTSSGWGKIARPYHALTFDGFYPFRPSHPNFKGLISEYDLNCAVSTPNALHGSRFNIKMNPASTTDSDEPTKLPSIQSSTKNSSFTLHSLKIKPLNFPINSVTVSLRGTRAPWLYSSLRSEQDSLLNWQVDFPAGYHEVLNVSIQEFTHERWGDLSRLELWADFQNAGSTMDWEFCVDDLEIEIHAP